jgi:hypothetical protein
MERAGTTIALVAGVDLVALSMGAFIGLAGNDSSGF